LSQLKKLAGQTAIYGLSSIIGRLLNYLLVPLYTRFFIPEEYGVVTEMYAYVSFLIIILTYGTETAFFRFSNTEENKSKVYSTILTSILVSSAVFLVLTTFLSSYISEALGYADNTNFIVWILLIIALDAISSIPFARLRFENKALKFASLRLVNIFTNIFFNLLFIVFAPEIVSKPDHFLFPLMDAIYNPEIGVGYIFLANLIANFITLLFLLPYFKISFSFDYALWKRIMSYSFPLVIAGLAGMTNETADRILIKYLLPPDIALHELGIYGACYKISILMTIFIQAFRFAAEPFFFSQAANKNQAFVYSKVMNYFVIACSFIFLGVMVFIDIVALFVGEAYREGIKIVPVLLIANLFLGMFFNLSIWYKLSGKTRYGAALTITGAVITLLFNFLLIPLMGYMGAALTTLICYFIMMLLSYYWGQKHFPVPYNIKKISFYILFSILLFFVAKLFQGTEKALAFILGSALLLIYLLSVFLIERPKKINSNFGN
jgi:O-antigen/teichoic acid export membrane protein